MPDFKALIERLKVNEGFRSDVYKCSEGFDTIGYGFAIKDLELTEEEATLLLANRVAKKHLMISKNLDWYDDLPPEVQGVIIEMVYQMGFTGFTKFKRAIAHMKNREWQLASEEMLDSLWARQTTNRAKQLADIVQEHG